ncbi:MAG TPA: GH25 family lysozyme [Jatrophihabitans sp.]|nr:GH25 family lysozyme [Jatrophihabitans sp.]
MTLTAYVDISSHNGTPNLRAYWDAGYRELMLKATEGTGYAWDQMQALARQWHSFGADARVGYYHWLYGTLSAAAQFAWFQAHVAPVFRPGDRVMIDFEDVDPSRWVPDAQHRDVLAGFAQSCRQQGWPTHIYGPDWYLGNLPLCVAFLRSGGWPIVASDYSHSPPGNRFGLNQVIHQFTDRATVPGFSGPVDCNRWLSAETADGGSATPIAKGPFMTLPQPTLDAMVHQVGVIDANVKSIYAWANSTLLRVAAIGASVDQQAATLAALQAAVAALQSAPAGAVDLSPVTALLAKLPAEVRALIEAQPLIIGGTAK